MRTNDCCVSIDTNSFTYCYHVKTRISGDPEKALSMIQSPEQHDALQTHPEIVKLFGAEGNSGNAIELEGGGRDETEDAARGPPVS